MKRVIAFGFVLFLLFLLLPGVAFAGDDGKGDNDQPKTGMLGEDVCGIFTGEYGGSVIADAYWAFYGANNTYFLKCIGELPDGVTPPAETVEFRGVTCFTPWGVTSNSKTVIEPDGEVRLVCKISP